MPKFKICYEETYFKEYIVEAENARKAKDKLWDDIMEDRVEGPTECLEGTFTECEEIKEEGMDLDLARKIVDEEKEHNLVNSLNELDCRMRHGKAFPDAEFVSRARMLILALETILEEYEK